MLYDKHETLKNGHLTNHKTKIRNHRKRLQA